LCTVVTSDIHSVGGPEASMTQVIRYVNPLFALIRK
jgi:hypothetical protein